jgi:hypothetical protein|nr:MAG TPA_asm: hypothetical protein [Caudoviricetes sp.]
MIVLNYVLIVLSLALFIYSGDTNILIAVGLFSIAQSITNLKVNIHKKSRD